MRKTSVCEKTGLRKGAWSPEEDKVLETYITNNGHGTWNELPKLAGLLRCGKSCRLRWKNYLDPKVKRGDFTKEEADFIIEMHKLGHRWSKIASHLPGRTDNDIKNFYYTHFKKRDNQTPNRRRPKGTGNEITIGEIQSSSIPILESSSMQPIPPQIPGSSSSQTSSFSIDRCIESHILKEPERDTIINLNEGSHNGVFPFEKKTSPLDYDKNFDPIIPISLQISGSSLSQPISSQTPSLSSSYMDKYKSRSRIIEETEREALPQIYARVWEEGLSEDLPNPIPPSDDHTYPWDCEDDYGSPNFPNFPITRSFRLPRRRHIANFRINRLHERAWEEGLTEDLHLPVSLFENTSDLPISPQFSGSSKCEIIQIEKEKTPQTSSHSSSSVDESENVSRILEDTKRGSLIIQIYERIRSTALPCLGLLFWAGLGAFLYVTWIVLLDY